MGFCDTLKLLPVSGKLCSDEVVCGGTSNYLMFENSGFLTLPMLKLLFSKAQECKDFLKTI